MKVTIILGLAFLMCSTPNQLMAHSGEIHGDSSGKKMVMVKVAKIDLKQINQAYLKEVKSILEKKCFDCHGTGKQLPWYASIPGPKQLIQWDIDKAKEHFDMSEDFPFKGHGNPVEDLEAIIKSTKKGDMPPLRFLLLNWEKKLSDAEEKLIIDWAKDSLQIIQD